MKEYKPFAISNFRAGFDEALEPWLLPRDAYQSVINAHFYRGVLEKIPGYQLFAPFVYKTYYKITVNGSTTTFTGTLSPLPATSNITAIGTISLGPPETAETFSFGSFSTPTLTLTGSAGGTAMINLSTGVYTITYNTAPPNDNMLGNNYFIYDSFPASPVAIMGIKQYFSSSGLQQVLVFDQTRLGIITNETNTLAQNILKVDQYVKEIAQDYYQSAFITGNGATAVYTGTFAFNMIVPGTIVIKHFNAAGVLQNSFTDNSKGGFVDASLTSGYINYQSGVYKFTFTGNVTNTDYYDAFAEVYGAHFTGDIYNFFSYTQYNNVTNSNQTANFNAYFSNGVDPVCYYDGTYVHQLNTDLSTPTGPVVSSDGYIGYDITKALFVFMNRDRLLLINCMLNVNNNPTNQQNFIYWSTLFNPLVFTNDEFLPAPTSEAIQAIGFINSDLVCRFNFSERIFRYTDDVFSPFRWDSTNTVWSCDSHYGTINYDRYFTSITRGAIVASDGVNVKRNDEAIPDFTDPNILTQQLPVPWLNQTSIQIAYGERFDDIKEGWLCYNSQPSGESTITASDNVLAYNYLDGTYAIYSFPFSCLGFGVVSNVETWGSTFSTWGDSFDTWGDFNMSLNAQVDLAGDQFDKVYQLNSGNSLGDGMSPVLMSVISKNFNPFIEEGELARLGYIDLFVSANNNTTLRVQFYLNDELYLDANKDPAGFYQESIIQFTQTDAMSSANQTKVWKRIFVGSVGKSHTIRFYQNEDDFSVNLNQMVYIHAMVLYMKPAGRIYN